MAGGDGRALDRRRPRRSRGGSRGRRAARARRRGGVAQLTKALSNELAGRGVRVNAVAPGYIETDMTSTLEDSRRKEVDARIPIGRWGTPDEIADVVRFFSPTTPAT